MHGIIVRKVNKGYLSMNVSMNDFTDEEVFNSDISMVMRIDHSDVQVELVGEEMEGMNDE